MVVTDDGVLALERLHEKQFHLFEHVLVLHLESFPDLAKVRIVVLFDLVELAHGEVAVFAHLAVLLRHLVLW